MDISLIDDAQTCSSTPVKIKNSETAMVSNRTMTISVLSKHVLPQKGYQTRVEKFKAFSTVIGGVIYMLVSYTHD